METELAVKHNYLDLTYDAPFKAAFGKHECFVKGLIEAATDIKVESLSFLDKELISIHPSLKQMKGDIIVCVNDNIIVDVEMQKQKLKSNSHRVHVYLNALMLSQIQRGCAYNRYEFVLIYLADYDWKEAGEVISQALIMDRTEKGIVFNNLTAMKYIGLNEVKGLDQKEVKDFEALDGWIYYLKHRHEEGLREKIEEIKARDETIRDLDNCMLDLEDDVSFMRKMSIAIDKACDEMDLRDAQEAREEARLAKQKAEVAEQKAEVAEQKAEVAEQEAEAEKQKAEAEKQKAEAAERKAEVAKQEAEAAEQKAEVAKREADKKDQLFEQYKVFIKQGYSVEEAELLARKEVGLE